MKQIIVIGVKLMIICAVAAICLGFVNGVTAPKIAINKEIALQEALATVNKVGVPQTEIMVDGNATVKSYYPVTEGEKEVSYILNLIGEGYAGDMVILANFTPLGEVLAVVLMDNQETPGLGKNAEKPQYMTKYIGTGETSPVPTRKNQLSAADADAIGGATITFAGIGKALDIGSGFAKKIGE